MRRLLLALFLPMLAWPGDSGYRSITNIPIGGEGGWDYLTVDPASHRLYVSHGMQVEVVDLDKGAKIGQITGTKGVHGTAIALKFGKGFTSNGQSDTVTVFDLKTLQATGELKTGKKPDGILYDAASGVLIVSNNGGDSMSLFQASDGKLIATVELGGAPEAAAVDGKGHAFVNLEDKNEIVKFDLKSGGVLSRWPLSPCETPTSLAFDPKTNRLFAGCRSKVMAVVNAANGKVVATIPIGAGVDAGAFDSARRLIFASCGDGTVAVIRQDGADKYSLIETLQTQAGAKTMAFDATAERLYLSVADYETAPTDGNKKARRAPKPGTFQVLVFGK